MASLFRKVGDKSRGIQKSRKSRGGSCSVPDNRGLGSIQRFSTSCLNQSTSKLLIVLLTSTNLFCLVKRVTVYTKESCPFCVRVN